jgi:hypothetical protein
MMRLRQLPGKINAAQALTAGLQKVSAKIDAAMISALTLSSELLKKIVIRSPLRPGSWQPA